MPGAPRGFGAVSCWIGSATYRYRGAWYSTPTRARHSEEAAGGFAALRLGDRRNMTVLEHGLGGRTRRGLPLEVAR